MVELQMEDFVVELKMLEVLKRVVASACLLEVLKMVVALVVVDYQDLQEMNARVAPLKMMMTWFVAWVVVRLMVLVSCWRREDIEGHLELAARYSWEEHRRLAAVKAVRLSKGRMKKDQRASALKQMMVVVD